MSREKLMLHERVRSGEACEGERFKGAVVLHFSPFLFAVMMNRLTDVVG